MIVIEDILEAVVGTIGEIDLKDRRIQAPYFDYGTKDQLNIVLEKGQNDVYPLIWQIPSKEDHGVNHAFQITEFIIAVNHTKEDLELSNKQRQDLVFKQILNPLTDKFLEALSISNNVHYDVSSKGIFKLPNFKLTGENDVVHLWDALTLTIDATYFNNC